MAVLCWKSCTRRSELLRPLLSRHFGCTSKLHQIHSNSKSNRTPDNNSRVSSLLPGQILVGPPHPVSNIRPIKFYIPSDETSIERKYRELREHAVTKDHEFWLDNNTRFEQGKAEFERHATVTKGACTLDDLSEYFRQYQVDSFGRHLEYNRYVWRRNLAMVWPGLCAWIKDIRRRKRRRMDALARHSEQSYFDQQESSESVVAERIQSTGPNNVAGSEKGAGADCQKEGPLAKQAKPESLDSDVDRRAEKIKSYY
ncbi:hypothetical protein IW140_001844 [Coemansia sp. RSA 1813]|nr:hypothetical protein EV178_002524 [Coemansia sp. RSA 1646]KAJ1772416.1 hypothetical protein LPJ74_001506 [Coemansia sp. RSA 1843]KAJ2091138.1 hypothetical protein IW138_002100 [Coemansia sp. RSA 986]KAJ2213609.1 hypothetical protein EV179_003725 [Coemansia sp. RSA 487]KAJ2571141.1 hypothetical protein IW140_001844 [Coemansia sp. RSA 1813]